MGTLRYDKKQTTKNVKFAGDAMNELQKKKEIIYIPHNLSVWKVIAVTTPKHKTGTERLNDEFLRRHKR